MSTQHEVLDLLAQITEVPDLDQRLDLPLYEAQVLDSLRTVELIVSLEEKFGIEISPAEFDRAAWATPRLIVANLEHRVGR